MSEIDKMAAEGALKSALEAEAHTDDRADTGGGIVTSGDPGVYRDARYGHLYHVIRVDKNRRLGDLAVYEMPSKPKGIWYMPAEMLVDGTMQIVQRLDGPRASHCAACDVPTPTATATEGP